MDSVHKKILGLDLGTTTIGWSVVEEHENRENSKIIDGGVRVVSLTIDEKNNFEKGNSITINAERTLKRSSRRNNFRYKLRRQRIINTFKKIGFINNDHILREEGKKTTHQLLKLRAKAPNEQLSKVDFVRVLLSINKKRGYKSNRKKDNSEDLGQAIDNIEIAKILKDQNITIGQYVLQKIQERKKEKKTYEVPVFYKSDLQREFDIIFDFQQEFYPNILTDKLKKDLYGLNRTQTASAFRSIFVQEFKNNALQKWEELKDKYPKILTAKAKETYFENQQVRLNEIEKFFKNSLNIILPTKYIAEPKGKSDEKQLQQYSYRTDALNKQLDITQVAYILIEINSQINQASKYLGIISDRSKKLHFKGKTIGQYLYEQIERNPHTNLRNQIFYRKDYINEFDAIWQEQKKHYHELDSKLEKEIKDTIIFYQRPLKSCKHLISDCQFEKHHKACSKSSPLFQEFKIWQNINDLTFTNVKDKTELKLDLELKQVLFEHANLKFRLSKREIFKILGYNLRNWKLNFEDLEGNHTNYLLYQAFQAISNVEGYEFDFSMSADEIRNTITKIFKSLDINTDVLNFDSNLRGNDFDKQSYFQLWHLIYSIENNEKLIQKLHEKFGFKKSHGKILTQIRLDSDYGNLSARAIRKILPHLKEGYPYDKACQLAGYNHSHVLNKKQIQSKPIKDTLDLLPKNALRTPVIEKILNQTINTVNEIIKTYGKPDEIRVELARELKQSKEDRKKMIAHIRDATKKNEEIRKKLQSEYKIEKVTRNDIIRYKLWEETKGISIYTGKPIKVSALFTNKYNIDHIIPTAKLFDDSFSNKILCERKLNQHKSDQTAYDFLKDKYNETEFEQYKDRVDEFYKKELISKTKRSKLRMKSSEIPEDFIERDLRDSQYIAKKTIQILGNICKKVHTTTGKVTDRLREDWGLIDIMKEINFDKYERIGLTNTEKGEKGDTIYKIKGWAKRDDHRHHAMDALIVAFTKPSHIQYLNNLKAKSNKTSSIYGIEQKELYRDHKNKLRFKKPFPNFRGEAKSVLENMLISFKAKNKTATKNINKIKIKDKNKFKKQVVLTPRGPLHKDTLYRKIKRYQTKQKKIDATLDLHKINSVANFKHKNALINRLQEFNNNFKKAFSGKNSFTKNPVLDCNGKTLPEKVKLVTFKEIYTIRKEVKPDLKIEKIIDKGIQKILQNRIEQYNGDKKKALSNLEENPIYLNKEKNIQIKKVSITGITSAKPIKRKNTKGEIIQTDFVQTRNNQHIAIYEDEKGNWQEEVVSFWETVERKKQGLPIIDKIKNRDKGWKFLFSIAQNDYFIFGNDEFNPQEIDLTDPNNFQEISKHLFRVQKISSKDYYFRSHLETNVDRERVVSGKNHHTNEDLKGICYYVVKSLPNIKNKDKHPLTKAIKVRINRLGKIVEVNNHHKNVKYSESSKV